MSLPNRIRTRFSILLILVLFLTSLPLQAARAAEPSGNTAVTVKRIGELPVGTLIRDSSNWDYFSSGGAFWNEDYNKIVYKTAPVTWILVLKDAYANDTSLFVSQEVVAELIDNDAMDYWVTSDLRSWMIGKFEPTFSPAFRQAIYLTTTASPWSDNLADDRFFALSAGELGERVPVDPNIKTFPANYRKSTGYLAKYYWTRTSVTYSPSYAYVVDMSNGTTIYSPNELTGIRPAVNLKSDALVAGPYTDQATGESYYMPIYDKYRATTTFANTVPGAGEKTDVLIRILNADDSIDTTFNGPADVTITGYEPAPNGTTGSLADTDLEDAQKTVSVIFSDGEATVPLVLHSTAPQSIRFHIEGLWVPETDPVTVAPTPEMTERNVAIERQPVGPDSEGGGILSVQPKLKIVDKFGNPVPGETVRPEKKAGSGDWTLAGNASIQSDAAGVAEFTNLSAFNPSSQNHVEGAIIQFEVGGETFESAPFRIVKDTDRILLNVRPVPHENIPVDTDPGKFRRLAAGLYLTNESYADILFAAKAVDEFEIKENGIVRSRAEKQSGILTIIDHQGSMLFDSVDPVADMVQVRYRTLEIRNSPNRIDIWAASGSREDSSSIILVQAPTDIELDVPDRIVTNKTVMITGRTDTKAELPITAADSEGTEFEIMTDANGDFSFEWTSPSDPGSVSLTVEAPGVNQPLTVTKSVTIYEPLTVEAPDECRGIVGQALTCQPSAEGGIGSRSWAIRSGTLPPGLSIDADTGLLSGIPTADGTYKVTIEVADSVNEKAAADVTIEIKPENTAPTVSGVGISGTAQVDRTLTGTYTYSDRDGDPEGSSIFSWYMADDNTGTNKVRIAEATGLTFKLTTAQLGKYVTFEVAPAAASGVAAGNAVESAAVGPVAKAPSNPGSSSGSAPSGGSSQEEKTPQEGVQALINGLPQNDMVNMNTAEEGGQTHRTVTVNASNLAQALDNAARRPTIVIAVTSAADKVDLALAGDALRAVEDKEGLFELHTPNGNYKIPVKEILNKLSMKPLGGQAALEDVTVHILIAKGDQTAIQRMDNAAANKGLVTVAPPIEFSVTAAYQGKSITIGEFDTFMERAIPIPAGKSSSAISTAVALNEDGSLRSVPTSISILNGTPYAIIRSMTNGLFSLVQRPISLTDMDGHWARNAVDDMASRMVVNGADNNLYKPNAPITRAEFAAVIARGLGLPDKGEPTGFVDVKAGDWYAVAAAQAQIYGIVTGYGDGTFRPLDTITREEAMTMIARTMMLVGLRNEEDTEKADDELSKFTDGSTVSAWARKAAAEVVKSGLIGGNNAKLMPKEEMTRAETAVIVRRLLVAAKLID